MNMNVLLISTAAFFFYFLKAIASVATIAFQLIMVAVNLVIVTYYDWRENR